MERGGTYYLFETKPAHTPAMGEWRIEANERKTIPEVLQAQIASTLAAAVGEDWCAAEPKAAKPITGVITTSNH